MNRLEHLKEEIEKCVRCGTCRSVCPTFKAIGREQACARGKLTLIEAYLRGDIALSEDYTRAVKECTLCGACRANCPNGVNTTGVFAAARADIIEKQGLPLAANFIFKNLADSKLVPSALKWASRFQGLFFKGADEQNGLLSRFSLPIIGNGRLLPRFSPVPFLEMDGVRGLGDRKKFTGTSGKKVAFYAGCGINYLMPGLGLKSLEVLKRAGVTVIVPSGQVCCGMPAYSSGDTGSARKMALKNLEVFESYDFDFITTSCATCGYGLKKLFRDILSDAPSLKERVEAVSSKVRDITELLVNELNFRGPGAGDTSKVVTYHDPCHLGRAQGVREEPRQLIESASGVKLKEMKNPCACCGLGGGLSVTNYDLSMEITKKKVDNIRNSGADIVATACPGCMVQLRDGLHRLGVDIKVTHVVELL